MLDRLEAAHARLLVTLGGLTEATLAEPSLLPGWSVAHVLAHIARNADSAVRRLEGSARGEIVDQYPGGAEGRAAEIEASAHGSLKELVHDVTSSSARVESVAGRLAPEAWARPTRAVDGELQTAEQVVLGRIREVEVHHVDLGLAYGPSDWPADFVEELLAAEVPRLRSRAGDAALLAWLTDRGPAPDLPAWRP